MHALEALYAVIDTQFWSIEELNNWALLEEATQSETEVWVLELSCALSYTEAEGIVEAALRANQLSVTELAQTEMGLIYRKWKQGRVGWEQAHLELVDVADAYDEGLILGVLAQDRCNSLPSEQAREHLEPVGARAVSSIMAALLGPPPR